MERSTLEPAPVESSWSRMLPTILAVLAIAVHLGSLRNGFTFDDPYIVAENPLVSDTEGPWRIFTSHYWAAQEPQGDLYRPVTILSYWANYRLAGPAPWSYHLVNCLLHGAVTALAFQIFRRLTGGAFGAAAAGAILFAVHPAHTEAVASIVGRAELLAALLVLGAWLERDRLWIALPLFACGLLAKESAVVLPALLMVEDLKKHRVRSSLRRYPPFLMVVAGWVALRWVLLGPIFGARAGPFAGTPAAVRIMTSVEVLGRYLWLMIWPAKLSADYSYDQIPVVVHPLSAGFLAGAAAIAACLVTVALAWKRLPALSGGILIFLVALLPVSNIFFGIGVMMAERLLYLPSLGLCMAAGAVLEALCAAAGSRRLVTATCLAAAAPAILLAARAATRTVDWFDQLTLFEATVRTSPRSALGRVNLATIYEALGRREEAEGEFRRAIEIAPDRPGPYFGLGSVLEKTGRLDEAMKAYGEAARLDPDDARPRWALRRLREAVTRTERPHP